MKTIGNKERAKGFTIIEVVLVLAIAGLIFLMVFIALPALQRSQRDSQRRNDVGTFISQLTQYSTNNNGGLPASGSVDDFATSYLKWKNDDTGEFKDPKTGKGYTLVGGVEQPDQGEMVYGGRNTTCDGEMVKTLGATETNNRQAAVAVALEGGGAFCQTIQQ